MKIFASLFATLATVFLLTALQSNDNLNPDLLPNPISDVDYHGAGVQPEAKVELGRLLFFDKILSGNKNISCATCHHPDEASGDGLSLGFGEGAKGIGPDRKPGNTTGKAIHERVPRNAPALFNLGAIEFTRMFHDGRVEIDEHQYYEGGFITPAKWKLPAGLDNVLAAQAMFPVTSPTEMAGQKGENPIADARSLNRAAGPNGVWALLAGRLQDIPEYVKQFQLAYPNQVASKEDISMVLAANAIASFEATAFRADNSPFDAYLREEQPLSAEAMRGLALFYGKAQCQTCHAGKFQTDHDFHAIAMPQIGPGKSDGSDATYWRNTGQKAFLEDFGRGRVTVRDEDAFKFRTPSLRNVALTGPWGHAGAFASLEEAVRHHLDPVKSLLRYNVDDQILPPTQSAVETFADGPQFKDRIISSSRFEAFMERDAWVQKSDHLRSSIATANELEPIELSDSEVSDLLSFLESLTDTSTTTRLASIIPDKVLNIEHRSRDTECRRHFSNA